MMVVAMVVVAVADKIVMVLAAAVAMGNKYESCYLKFSQFLANFSKDRHIFLSDTNISFSVEFS